MSLSYLLLLLFFYIKKSGVKERELTSFRKESKGSKIELFAIVDLDNQHTFALKVRTLYCLANHSNQYF